MSMGTLSYLDSPRNNSDSLSVVENLYKTICEIGGGIFAGVCRSEQLVLWKSPATGATLCCPVDQLSADIVRSKILQSDTEHVITLVEL
jgi:hypothetical protein